MKVFALQRSHTVLALLFLAGVLIFNEISKESVVVFIFKVSGYTYGLLLAIFCVGLLTGLKPKDSETPYIAVASILITAFIDMFSERFLYGYNTGLGLKF